MLFSNGIIPKQYKELALTMLEYKYENNKNKYSNGKDESKRN